MTIANLPPANHAPSDFVTVSIVVNTVDRAISLATLLAALEHQSYPNFELIVVVGPTHDDTLAVLDRYVGRVRVLRCGRANLSESRNIGLLAAHGEIVAFIDDDAVPSYHWLAQVVAAFGAAESAAQDIAIVGGSVYLVHPQQPAIQHWLGMMSDLGEQQDVRLDGTTRPEGMGVFWTERPMGANMAFRRRTLLAAGGFDGYYQWVFDDADIAMRLALAGHGVRSLTEAPVYHVPASSRNRVARTHSGRWWIVTKASTYFAVQNGHAARQPARQVLLRVLYLVHGSWLVNWQLYHYGHIRWREMWARRLRAVAAGTQGALHGLGRRRLLATGPENGTGDDGDMVLFLQPDSVVAPAVNPISGERGTGPYATPPLRIGLIAESFVDPSQRTRQSPEQLAAVTRALFQMGHTVHVLTAGKERTIIFQDGAYIHAELLPYGEHSLVAGIRRLVENDGIQLLVGPAADLAVAVTLDVIQVQLAVAQDVAGQPTMAQQATPWSIVESKEGMLPAPARRALEPLLVAGYDIAVAGWL